jgi:UPF0755 protein
MIRKILFWGFIGVFITTISIIAWVYQVIVTLQEPLQIPEGTSFDVTVGATWDTIIQDLSQKKYVERTYGATFYTRFRQLTPKQGEYRLTPSMTLGQTLDTIHRGIRSRPEVTITIPEGSDIREIGAIVEQSLDFTAEDFLKASTVFDTTNYDFVESDSLEGYLFPDTYRFFTTATPDDVIRRMLDTFQIKALPVLTATDELSAYQVLILASIIEKEVITPEDMRIVSGIFMNRLRDGMLLQSDATLNYVVRAGRDRANAQDLALDSPYNSYKNPGLTPTPITNMGIESIKAASEPRDHDLYFFLTTRDTPPKTIFSRTYDEHLQAIRTYLD